MRPLTAALAVLGGDFELSGVPRMHERPIGDLVDALRQLGCQHRLPRATKAIRRCASASPRWRWTSRSGARRRVQPVPHRLLMALPLVAKRRHRDRGGGRADLQALHRNHAEPAGALWRRRCSATAGSASPFPAGSRYQLARHIHVEADASSASYFIALGRNSRGSGAKTASRSGRGRGLDPGRHPLHRSGAPWARRSQRPQLAAGPPRRLAAQGHRPGLQPHPRRRHDAGRDGPVRRRAPPPAQHRQLARQGNRPHCRHGHRAAQARRHGGGRPDFIRVTPPAHPRLAPPASTPTTTTAWPCAFRWRPSTRPAAGAHRRPQVRGQDLSGLLRGPVLGGHSARRFR
jgi:hypothetical protein